jgi:hypothetical protein
VSATETRLRGRTRWSAASKCARWAALGLLGAEPAEPTQRQQRLWRRGRQLGDDRAQQLRDRYGAENVIREKAVSWPTKGLPLGELHTDAFVIPESLAIEVKSSTSPTSILESAITQLAGEMHFDPEAKNGALMVVDPTGWNDDILVPVVLTDDLVARVEQIAADVAGAAKGGALPDCVCASPGACRMMGCPFTEEAWKDWTAPDPKQLDGEAAQLVRDLYYAKQQKDEHKATLAESDTKFREICTRLLELGIDAGCDYNVGPLRLRRTRVNGRETFSLTTARKAGILDESLLTLLEPFIRVGDPHDRWYIDRVGDGALEVPAEDYGDVPF